MGFLIRRFVQSCAVLVVVSVVVFALIHLLPGSPARAELGPKANRWTIAAFNRENGFDHPLYYQYILYIDHLLHGNFGYSYEMNASVGQLFGQRFPKSMLLLFISLLISVVISIPLGVYQAARRNSGGDYAFTGAAFVLYAFPTFWLGFILIAVFSVTFHIFPPVAPEGNSVTSILAHWQGLVLPVLTLSLGSVASYSRYMRSSLIDSLAQDYIVTAKGKGLTERAMLFRHALRNSLIPMASLIGMSLPGILGGAVVTEEVFNYPGVGLLFYQATEREDFPVLMGLTMIAAVGVVVGNLLADVLYVMLDPRIRY